MSDLPLSTADVTQEVKVRKGDSGQEALAPKTVMAAFDAMVKKNGSKPALHQKRVEPVSLGTVALLLWYDRSMFNLFLIVKGKESRRYRVDDVDVEAVSRTGRRLWQGASLFGIRTLRHHVSTPQSRHIRSLGR